MPLKPVTIRDCGGVVQFYAEITGIFITQKVAEDRFWYVLPEEDIIRKKGKIVLKEDELINSDVMFGLTRKLLGEDYLIVKKSIYKELKGLAKQIGEYLELPKRMVYLQ